MTLDLNSLTDGAVTNKIYVDITRLNARPVFWFEIRFKSNVLVLNMVFLHLCSGGYIFLVEIFGCVSSPVSNEYVLERIVLNSIQS